MKKRAAQSMVLIAVGLLLVSVAGAACDFSFNYDQITLRWGP